MSAHDPHDPLDAGLLDRWLAGAASEGEAATVHAWRDASPANAAWLAALRAAVAEPVPAAPAATDAAWAALVARAGLPQPAAVAASPAGETVTGAGDGLGDGRPGGRGAPAIRVVDGTRAIPAPVRSWRLRRVAGALAAGLGVVLATLVVRQVARRAPAGDLAVVVAAPGQRATATLPDGSQVTLAPGSRLAWSRRAYGASARDLVLEGEGYFVAVHDAHRPFRVHAGRAVVLDIGTRFAVRAGDATTPPEVAVEEGAVALADSVAGDDDGTVLRAGQRARLAPDGRVTLLGDAAPALAWVGGTLVFDDVPLPEVLVAVGRWYGTPLRADARLSARRITARFDAQSLRTLTTALAVTLHARVVQAGDTLLLRPIDP